MDLTTTVFERIDMRSFSNLWYWIALAVTWSTASHWIIGVPWDAVQRARRIGGAAEADLRDLVRANVNRYLAIDAQGGLAMLAVASFGLTSLAVLGFYYRVEFCQAVFLIALPLSAVFYLGLRTARMLAATGENAEELYRRLGRHRIAVQAIGMVSIFVTAFWGMLQNFNVAVF